MPAQTRDWTFWEADAAGLTPADQQRFRLQASSDVYRAMQTRLDGYRQSAAAIFLGVVAGLLTLDASLASAFGKIITGAETTNALVHFRVGCVLVAAALGILLAGIFVQHLVWRIGYYFAEMSGVVYQFDLAHKLFERDALISSRTVYPEKFRATEELVIGGETWLVWFDPSIKMFLTVVRTVFSLNTVIFLAIGFYMLRHAIAAWICE
jgi:MFS family permease